MIYKCQWPVSVIAVYFRSCLDSFDNLLICQLFDLIKRIKERNIISKHESMFIEKYAI